MGKTHAVRSRDVMMVEDKVRDDFSKSVKERVRVNRFWDFWATKHGFHQKEKKKGTRLGIHSGIFCISFNLDFLEKGVSGL